MNSRPALNPVDITIEPIQEEVIAAPAFLFRNGYGSFTLAPRAVYRISGRILAVRRFLFGWEAALSPIDVALIWGKWAERTPSVFRRFELKNRGYRYETVSLPEGEIGDLSLHISNNHLIPASSQVKRGLNKLRSKDRIHIEGFLVDVMGNGPERTYRWKTSLDRLDTGQGACELVLVESIQINGSIYSR